MLKQSQSQGIGQLIRYYRQRQNLSQLDLELAIGSAEGLISKIELGKVNPTKETLSKLITALELSPLEAAQLFEINYQHFAIFIALTRKLQSAEDLTKLIDTAVDDIIQLLGLTGASIYLIENNKLHLRSISTIRHTQLARQAFPFSPFRMSFDLESHTKNILVKTALSKQAVVTHNLVELVTPYAPEFITRQIQLISRNHAFMILPLLAGDLCLGVMVFGKSNPDQFELEAIFLHEFVETIAQLLAKFQ